MNYKHKILILAILLFSAPVMAGDVVYTMWEDDQGMFWVRIQNDTDRTIRVGSILIVFYNAKGTPIEERNAPCQGNCRLLRATQGTLDPMIRLQVLQAPEFVT